MRSTYQGLASCPPRRIFATRLEQFADVLTDFIIMKDLKKITLVGASFGATIILLALLRNRDELGSTSSGAMPYKCRSVPTGLSILHRDSANAGFGALCPRLSIFPPNSCTEESAVAIIKTARLLNAKRLAPYVERFKTIYLPTLVIWGRKDSIVPLRVGKRLARDLPNSRLVVIDHCGHSPHTECPAKVIAALKEFTQKTSENVPPD